MNTGAVRLRYSTDHRVFDPNMSVHDVEVGKLARRSTLASDVRHTATQVLFLRGVCMFSTLLFRFPTIKNLYSTVDIQSIRYKESFTAFANAKRVSKCGSAVVQTNRAWCEIDPGVHMNCRFYTNESYRTESLPRRETPVPARWPGGPHIPAAARLTRTLTPKQALEL